MRISADKTDPGYSPDYRHFKPMLDGVEVMNCITADEEDGMVLAYVLDARGKPQGDPGNPGRVMTEIRRGVVTIVDMRPERPAQVSPDTFEGFVVAAQGLVPAIAERVSVQAKTECAREQDALGRMADLLGEALDATEVKNKSAYVARMTEIAALAMAQVAMGSVPGSEMLD